MEYFEDSVAMSDDGQVKALSHWALRACHSSVDVMLVYCTLLKEQWGDGREAKDKQVVPRQIARRLNLSKKRLDDIYTYLNCAGLLAWGDYYRDSSVYVGWRRSR